MNQVKSNGASNSLFEHSRPNEPKKSSFDISRITNLTADSGMIIPIDCFKVYPGDNINLDSTLMLDTLPLVQSSLTQYKITTHWYYSKGRDLWKGSKTQVTKGRSGNVQRRTPTIDLSLRLGKIDSYDSVNGVLKDDNSGDLKGALYPEASHSLSALIGVPPSLQGLFGRSDTSTTNFNMRKAFLPYSFKASGSSDADVNYNNMVDSGFHQYAKPNALPFVMYQQICKYNYVNQNLLQDNTSLFPVEGDDDWLLPYNATTTNFIDYASNDEIDGSEVYSYDGVYSSSDTVTRLDQLRYAQFDDDYFTTGLPWLQRGDVSTIDFTATGGLLDVDYYSENGVIFDNSVDFQNSGFPAPTASFKDIYSPNQGGSIGFTISSSGSSSASGPLGSYKLRPKVDLTNATFSGTLTANEIRGLLAMSVWQERNARVNGSYNNMIYQHWAVNPNSEEHKPVYIGGSVDYLNFSTVIQNSSSTPSSPLGSTAGFGSSSGKSTINNNFFCEDYGYIMGVFIIKPITYYQQGVEHFLSCEDTFEDLIQPEFQGLSPEPIFNKELYVSGDSDADDDLFAWQERYTYAKVRQNVNRGLFQVKPEKDLLFGSFTQARWFYSTPKLSYQFLCMSPDNIRRDWLAYPSYPAFRIQFLTNCQVNRRLAFSSTPNDFGF